MTGPFCVRNINDYVCPSENITYRMTEYAIRDGPFHREYFERYKIYL